MIKAAIMGFGTIGSGVAEVLDINKKSIAARVGDEVELKYVLDLRDFEGDPIQEKIVHDYKVIAEDPEVAIVVETMGGVEPAYTFVKTMLEAGKHVTTSNKALVAAKGAELIALAKEKNVNFMFEASVGGGIPIIRPLNSCLTADEIEEITGIVNGTTNYMMTEMTEKGADFNEVLKDAQAKGYAEKDPTADVEGYDACRKIAILTSLVCGQQVDFEDILPEAIFEYDDKIWGMTFGVECQMVLYNKALFEEAGIDAPSTDAANPWTWEEYVDAAVKLTKDINGKHPGEEGFDSNNISVWGTKVFDSPIFNFTLLNSNGGAYIAAEGDRLLVDSEESKEVLKELQDLIYVHQVAPKPAVTSAMPSSQQMLMDGQLGMYMAGQFEIATFAEAEWGDFGVAPLPKFKKPASMIWGEPLVVYDSKDEKVNEAAVKLVLALSNPAEVNDLFVTAAQMPIYKSWYTDPEKKAVWTDNAWHNESLMSYFDSLFQTETTSREAYYVKNYDPIMAIVQPRLDKIWDGVDVDTALEGLQEEVAQEMQGYYKIVDYYFDAK